ncbi:hypothetical protein BDM02DRAFT_2236725 [Thelephora ganbajun]|uniref:Uncharacterized protein n=1 Tax=Thelephora ganbajun TaxID=370292 RepID=A0ACB6ZGR9_THEGA|nr:hypothetical protein BDM02DRAFT_2236725 [Thelephora ganbajun]
MLVGISYGGVFGLLPTIVVEWFGMAHFLENWGLVSLSPLVAGNVFSMTFGRIFDVHSSYSRHEILCLEGVRCYSVSPYATVSACLCGREKGSEVQVEFSRNRRRSSTLEMNSQPILHRPLSKPFTLPLL